MPKRYCVCGRIMRYQGNYTFQGGGWLMVDKAPGAEIDGRFPSFDLYLCPACDRVDFFQPNENKKTGAELHYASLRDASEKELLTALRSPDSAPERVEAAKWVYEERGLEPPAPAPEPEEYTEPEPPQRPASVEREPAKAERPKEKRSLFGKKRRDDPWD